MDTNFFSKKYSLLLFYVDNLKGAQTKKYKVLITTSFGAVVGMPDFNLSVPHNKFFYECVENNNYLISSYLNETFKEHDELLKDKEKLKKEGVLFPLIRDDDVVVINNATIYTGNTSFFVPSFTLFISSILGFSFIDD